jgi:uncharacterized membrane protein YuzA (DUF378 family)
MGIKIYKHKLAMLLVIAGALNWGLSVYQINIVEIINSYLDNTIGTITHFNKLIYITIAIAGLYLVNRDNFLPFLGKTFIPTSVIPLKTNKFQDDSVIIQVKPNSKVIYWAAKKSNQDKPDVWNAYDDYSNSGVIMADPEGKAVLKLQKGSGYIVPGGKYIKPHVHYRYERKPGKLSRIETVYY